MASWVARHGLTSAQYQAEFDDLVGQGFRLVDVSGYEVGGEARYAAIWEQAAGPAFVARHGLTSAEYQAEFDNLVGQGFRLVLVNGYEVGGEERYVAIWEQTAGPAFVARHGLTSAEYQAEFDSLVRQGFRLVHVSGYSRGGAARYAAIWEQAPGPAFVAHHGLTSAQYQGEFDTLVGWGFRLVHVSGYEADGEARYAAIWEQAPGPAFVARHGLTAAQYQGVFDNLLYQGHRLVHVSGYEVAGQDRYAAIWHVDAMSAADLASIAGSVDAYLDKHTISGLSLAIARDERLVYAAGFGLADLAAGEPVNPHHRFRIASVSKPVTAVHVMELVENGKLTLDSTVFGDKALLGTEYGTTPYRPGVQDITVRHLLEHTSGFTNDDGDPMFKGFATHAEVIDWMLDNRALKASPGTANEYSNFGYCVLGRIIEKVTDETYEASVGHTLAACGVQAMEIGGGTLAERKPDEVVYGDSDAYGLRPPHMDAHGGWIASSIDLLRFMVRCDGFDEKADVLYANSVESMFSGSAAGPGYGLGWIVEPSWKGHNGAMAGTLAFLVRRSDGFNFAVVANRRPSGDGFGFELKQVIDGLLNSGIQWPAYDLF